MISFVDEDDRLLVIMVYCLPQKVKGWVIFSLEKVGHKKCDPDEFLRSIFYCFFLPFNSFWRLDKWSQQQFLSFLFYGDFLFEFHKYIFCSGMWESQVKEYYNSSKALVNTAQLSGAQSARSLCLSASGAQKLIDERERKSALIFALRMEPYYPFSHR